jgi:DNA-binding CsgD family transcriptional regulator
MIETSIEFGFELWAARSMPEILTRCVIEFLALGVLRVSYHFAPAHHAATDQKAFVTGHGFATDWNVHYQAPAARAQDPVTSFIMQQGRPMPWQDAIDAQSLTPEQRDFVRQFARYHPIDGMGFPLCGPNGHDGYCSISLGRPITLADQPLLCKLRRIAQIGHERICVLKRNSKRTKIALSRRETQVLHHMARGQSNRLIANALNVAETSVDTYIRRLFAKLGAANRVEASVKGLSLGLISL